MLKTLIAATAILTASAGFACAHHHKAIVVAQAHPHHGAAAPSRSSAATKGYEAANAKMHKDMAIKFSGNADADFARGMIPHHQGAIDMALVQLQYSRNEKLRRLAQSIIVEQGQEIAYMRSLLDPPAEGHPASPQSYR